MIFVVQRLPGLPCRVFLSCFHVFMMDTDRQATPLINFRLPQDVKVRRISYESQLPGHNLNCGFLSNHAKRIKLYIWLHLRMGRGLATSILTSSSLSTSEAVFTSSFVFVGAHVLRLLKQKPAKKPTRSPTMTLAAGVATSKSVIVI